MSDKTIGRVRPDGFPAGANDGEVKAAMEAVKKEARELFANSLVDRITKYTRLTKNSVEARRVVVTAVLDAICRAGALPSFCVTDCKILCKFLSGYIVKEEGEEAARKRLNEETSKLFDGPAIEVIERQMEDLIFYAKRTDDGIGMRSARRTLVATVLGAIDRAGYVVKGKGEEAPLPGQKAKAFGYPVHDHNKNIRDASGNRVGMDRTQSFFYELMRDHLPPGKVEDIVKHVLEEGSEVHYCNGWLADYAAYIVKRLWEKEQNDETCGAS